MSRSGSSLTFHPAGAVSLMRISMQLIATATKLAEKGWLAGIEARRAGGAKEDSDLISAIERVGDAAGRW